MNKLLSTILLILISTPAFACKCSKGNLEQQFLKAERVFAGQVISAKVTDKLSSLHIRSKVVEATLELVTPYKGANQKTINIITDTSSCGLTIELGAQYLIFDKPNEIVPPCGGTRRLGYFGQSDIYEKLQALTKSGKATN